MTIERPSAIVSNPDALKFCGEWSLQLPHSKDILMTTSGPGHPEMPWRRKKKKMPGPSCLIGNFSWYIYQIFPLREWTGRMRPESYWRGWSSIQLLPVFKALLCFSLGENDRGLVDLYNKESQPQQTLCPASK